MQPTRSVWAWSIGRLLSSMREPPFHIELWNGETIGAAGSEARGTARLSDPWALVRLLWDVEMQAPELYSEGRLSFEGDLIGLLKAAYAGGINTGISHSLLPARLRARLRRSDLRSARRNAQYHYDVGNDFYQLWLDERMVYTCAYFPSPDDSLEEAQLAKMDHVCRKLRLRKGERVIEAGCGWGSLALHMARYYGVEVRAVNVSREQIAYARQQAEKQGLQDRVEFIEDDYRNITGTFDKFVSVGMLEHVGPENYVELGSVIDRCLEPRGLAFIHSIGRSRPMTLNRWIRKRIFPHAHPPSLGEMMQILEPNDLVVLDVENLRRHYATTLRHWFQRYEAAFDSIRASVGPETARAWHLYLAGSIAAFETGALQLFQVLFTRPANDEIAWTRAPIYEAARLLR